MTHAPLMIAGLCIALGLWLLLREAVPSQPHLGDALARLGPDNLRVHTSFYEREPNVAPRRLGTFLHRHLGHIPGMLPNPKDLDLLGVQPSTLLTRKLGYALAALVFPVVMGLLPRLVGGGLNLAIPGVAGLLLATLAWFYPDQQIKNQAAERRSEFVRTAVAYLQLVAIQRAANSGVSTAMTQAAELSDSWTFRRIREELFRAGIDHVPPWDALNDLGEKVGVSQMGDIGDIMRLAGTAGSEVGDTLLARASALRDQMLSDAHGRANAATETMGAPVAFLFVMMLLALAYPVAMALLG